MEVLAKSTDCGVEEINTGDSQPAQNTRRAARFDADALKYFCDRFLHEAGSDEVVASFLHPQGAVCPYCNKRIDNPRAGKSFYSLKRCACKDCGKWFTATTGTLLQGCHNPRAVFLLAVFMALGADAKQLAPLLNMHPASVQQWQKKFQAVAWRVK